MSQLSANLSAMDPDYIQNLRMLSSSPAKPLVGNVFERRAIMSDNIIPLMQKTHSANLPKESEYSVHDYQVPVGGDEIQVRSLVPRGGAEGETFPLLVWCYGGGWTMGSIHMDDYYLRKLCVDLQVSILSVGYRLAPEYPFPTGLNDSYAALKWAATNENLLSSALSKGFIVGGVSTGANLMTVLAHRARDDPFFSSRKLTGQLIQIPMIIHPDAYPDQYKAELTSIERNADAPFLSKADLLLHINALNPPPLDPEFSVLLAPDHSRLPPMFIQVGGGDPLCDEGLLYAKVLREAGVNVKLETYPGMHHVAHFWMYRAALCQKFWADFKDGLAWLLTNAK